MSQELHDFTVAISGKRSLRCIQASLAALCLCALARAENYADATKVNLFRKAGVDGSYQVVVAGVNFNNGGTPYAAYYGVDSGNYNWQVNFSSQTTTNSASFRVTLPQAVHVQTISLSYGGYKPVQHHILGSTSGFGSMAELVPWTNVSAAAYTYTVDTNIQYVQFDYLGSAGGPYTQVKEMQAFAGAGDVIETTAGYNLFAQRATATIDSDSGNWGDARTQAIDLNYDTLLRGSTSKPVTNWFIVDLGKAYILSGTAVGFYHGQSWPRIFVDVRKDKVTWVSGYSQDATTTSQMCPFSTRREGRYLRVTTYSTAAGVDTWGALCEFEAYAIPPPAGVSVILR